MVRATKNHDGEESMVARQGETKIRVGRDGTVILRPESSTSIIGMGREGGKYFLDGDGMIILRREIIS